MSPEEALTIRTMRKQGVSKEDLSAEFNFPLDVIEQALQGKIHPEAGGPFDLVGHLNPDGYEGAKREFCKRVLALLRDRMPPDDFFQLCSQHGLDVNNVLHF